MVSLSNHVAISLQQRRRFQRQDCQPPHRVRGRNDKFCNFHVILTLSLDVSIIGNYNNSNCNMVGG